MSYCAKLRVGLLSATMFTALAAPAVAQAQTAPAEDSDVIVVTGTRRALSIQDAPVNITAVGADQLKQANITDVRGLAALTPGITIQDTGPRNTGTVVMRGLNATNASSTGNDDNTAIATYIGEIPLYLDLKLLDIARVETLLGPQGTLYGAGTLAGAIRYIPNRPDPDKWSGSFHAKSYVEAHASNPGYQVDGTINIPIVSGKVALRSTVGYYNDPGFIDYNLLLNNPGTSLAQPGLSSVRYGQVGTPAQTPGAVSSFYGQPGTQAQIDANLHRYSDANFEHTFTTRNTLGLFPTDGLNIYLTYAYQQTKTNGRQANAAGALGTSNYESGARYLEPSDRKSHLISAEIEAELGDFAQLVSSTAYSVRKIKSTSDVTDLLLDLDYNYELFPAFSAYSNTNNRYKQFTQELRLVSAGKGPFSWMIGGFYNRLKNDQQYEEIVPGLASYYFGNVTFGPTYPREIEYASFIDSKTTEKAVFGELSYKLTDRWQVTAGGRYFGYDATISGGIALPLLEAVPAVNFALGGGSANKSGAIWKFNTSYKVTDDLMLYATGSKGYRIGGPNRVPACPADLSTAQNACALPNELFYGPDETYNKEIGIRATLFGGKLNINADAYHIVWKGIQLRSVTQFGATGITVNGGSAVSQGAEMSFWARPTRRLTIQGNYAYTDAHLTSNVTSLLDYRNIPGIRPKSVKVDALDGDRLPGSMKHSGTLAATYTMPLGHGDLIANWAATYYGNILTKPGARAYGEVLPDYVIHRASITYRVDDLEFRLFADNLFDKYAVTSVGNDASRRIINDNVVSRYYSNTVVSPRKLGVEVTKRF